MLAIKVSVMLLSFLIFARAGYDVATTPSTPAPAPAVTTMAPQSAPVAIPAHILFIDKVTPAVYELPSGALATWRQFAANKPALVLFAAHPLLDPLHAGDRDAVRNFVLTAPPDELVRRGRALTADPMLTSPQTLSAAIEAGLISELIFVQPTTKASDKISLSAFQQKAFAAGFFTEQEALALTLADGVISGTVRGLPFRCVHPEKLPKLAGPVLVHIDLGYFKDLFVDDIKSPPYGLLYDLITAIRASGWSTRAATLSYSNQEAEFSLETRFLISNLADVLERPEWLASGSPITWKMRADARYARAMIDETTAEELTAQAVAVSPDDPDALYDLAHLRLTQKRSEEALPLLDRATALDPGYALANLELIEIAVSLGNWKTAEELSRKAAAAMPDNPFIRIGLADLLIRRERGSEALPLLRDLQQLPWSPAYHPDTPGLLREMIEVAREQAAGKSAPEGVDKSPPQVQEVPR